MTWWVVMVFSEGSEGGEIVGCEEGLGRMEGGVEVLMVGWSVVEVEWLVAEDDKDGS